MTPPRPERSTLLAIALAVMLAAAPVAAQPLADGSADTPTIVRYGADADPSYIVDVSSRSGLDSLEAWANESSTRRIIRRDNGSNTSTVAAPQYLITGGLGSLVGALSSDPFGALDTLRATPLDEQSYVEEIHPNYELSIVRPVTTLADRRRYTPPTIGLTGANDPEYPTDGVAFSNDTEADTMAETRGYVDKDELAANGSGVLVAVIDTGCNVASPAGKLYGNGTAGSAVRIHNDSKSLFTNESVDVADDDYDAIQDRNGHGSWVASAIGANATNRTHDGVAPNADLLCLKAMNEDGEGSTSGIAAAVRYAADRGADIISMSLGSPVYSDALEDAVTYAQAEGSLVVVAAGNSRATRSPGVGSPADVPGVIAVGATNGSEPAHAASAYFSQVSGSQPSDGNVTNRETVDIAAPGMEITARVADDDGLLRNATLSGTSMATPIVSGAVAAAMSANATLNSSNRSVLREAVMDTATATNNTAVAEVGNGTIDAAALATGATNESGQAAAMTRAAQTRQAFYIAWADSRGGFIARNTDDIPFL